MDPRLERYRRLAPFSLEELTEATNGILGTFGLDEVTPRTVRYYISEGVLPPPEGSRKLARYPYTTLLALIAARAMQSRGWELGRIAEALRPIQEDDFQLRDTVDSLLVHRAPESSPHAMLSEQVARYDMEVQAFSPMASPRKPSRAHGHAPEVWHELPLGPRVRLQYQGDLDLEVLSLAQEAVEELSQNLPD